MIAPNMQDKMTKITPTDENDEPPLVVALVYDGLCTFEYGIVAEVFGLTRPELKRDLYRFASVSLERGKIRAAGGLTVTASGTDEDFENAHTIIVPGWRGKDEVVPEHIIKKLRTAHNRGVRIMSICSGVYVLAAAGLLNGRRVTTHWRYTDHFQQKFPDTSVQLDNLYVDEGDIITSAGSSAGIDACLHMVRKDYGAKIANTVARRLVMHAHRQGGQAQFIEQPVPKQGESHRLSELIEKIRNRLGDKHSIASMADIAGMSTRTFQRRFFASQGIAAMQWLMQERVSRSSFLLETSDLSVETISQTVGFSNAEALRYHFRQVLSVSPLEYRKRFSTKYDHKV